MADTSDQIAVARPASSIEDSAHLQRENRRLPLWRQFIKNDRVAVGAAIVVVAIVGIALAAPILPIAAPNTPHFGQRLVGPFHQGYILGTDQLGRDLLSR